MNGVATISSKQQLILLAENENDITDEQVEEEEP
jgi:hypothetical protein